jgi:hypothetical protein
MKNTAITIPPDNLQGKKYRYPFLWQHGLHFYIKLKVALSKAPFAGRPALPLFSIQLSDTAGGQTNLPLFFEKSRRNGEIGVGILLECRQNGQRTAVPIRDIDLDLNRNPKQPEEVIVFLSFIGSTLWLSIRKLTSRFSFSQEGQLPESFNPHRFIGTMGELVWDLSQFPAGSVGYNSFQTTEIAVWESENREFLKNLQKNPQINLLLYAFKQFPLDNLAAYYPLYNNFHEVITAGRLLHKEVYDPAFCRIDFEENAMVFDPQQAGFKLDLPYRRDFTCSFWMKLSADSLRRTQGCGPETPMRLWNLDVQRRQLLSVSWYYDEAQKKLVLLLDDPLNRRSRTFDFFTNQWFFFSVSYQSAPKKLYVTVLTQGRHIPAVETSAFITDIPSGADSLCWGRSATRDNCAEGGACFLSSLTLFANTSLHNFFNKQLTTPLHGADETKAFNSITLLHTLYRGPGSAWENFINNYIQNKETLK